MGGAGDAYEGPKGALGTAVPTSLEILDQARELAQEDEGLVFPANRSGKAMSDMTFTVLLRRLEIPAVPHGFRSSFKNWCNSASGPTPSVSSPRRRWPTTWGIRPRPRTRRTNSSTPDVP